MIHHKTEDYRGRRRRKLCSFLLKIGSIWPLQVDSIKGGNAVHFLHWGHSTLAIFCFVVNHRRKTLSNFLPKSVFWTAWNLQLWINERGKCCPFFEEFWGHSILSFVVAHRRNCLRFFSKPRNLRNFSLKTREMLSIFIAIFWVRSIGNFESILGGGKCCPISHKIVGCPDQCF